MRNTLSETPEGTNSETSGSENSIEQTSDTGLEVDLSNVDYEIVVFTSDRKDAGANAQVYIELCGTYGESGEMVLKNNKRKKSFQRGSQDKFLIQFPDLGDIHKIRVIVEPSAKNDNSKGWLLQKVTIKNMQNKTLWNFPCNLWFDDKLEGNVHERELYSEQQT